MPDSSKWRRRCARSTREFMVEGRAKANTKNAKKTKSGGASMASCSGRIMAGTADGVRLLEPRGGRWQVVRQGLDNGPVNALLGVNGAVLCGVLGWGVYWTGDSA